MKRNNIGMTFFASKKTAIPFRSDPNTLEIRVKNFTRLRIKNIAVR